jgi:hypothetical protein
MPPAARRWHAAVGPLERRVRPRSLTARREARRACPTTALRFLPAPLYAAALATCSGPQYCCPGQTKTDLDRVLRRTPATAASAINLHCLHTRSVATPDLQKEPRTRCLADPSCTRPLLAPRTGKDVEAAIRGTHLRCRRSTPHLTHRTLAPQGHERQRYVPPRPNV